jgi:hypothetical protein
MIFVWLSEMRQRWVNYYFMIQFCQVTKKSHAQHAITQRLVLGTACHYHLVMGGVDLA